jgi:hypothetical protein
MKTKRLNNSYIQIPLDDSFFINNYKNLYKKENTSKIDYESIYIEAYAIDYRGEMHDSRKNNSFIGALKFYQNNCINNFVFNRDSIKKLPLLDPSKVGYRGVYYFKENKQIISLVVPITQNRKSYGVKDYEFTIKGDTLTLKQKKSFFKYVYLKQKLSKENLKFRADW